jgi:hypothetical protein
LDIQNTACIFQWPIPQQQQQQQQQQVIFALIEILVDDIA